MAEDATELRGLTPSVIRRWRKEHNSSYSLATIDDFIRRHQATLENLVVRELVRRAGEGRTPTGVHTFAAYADVVVRERGIDMASDDEVVTRLSDIIQADFATGCYAEQSVLDFGREYVLARAEAMFVRVHGWDVVPLLVASPALAVVTTEGVIAVRTSMGSLIIHPRRRGTVLHLFRHIREAEEDVETLLDEMNLETNTEERLLRFARATWNATRAKIATQQGLKWSTQ